MKKLGYVFSIAFINSGAFTYAAGPGISVEDLVQESHALETQATPEHMGSISSQVFDSIEPIEDSSRDGIYAQLAPMFSYATATSKTMLGAQLRAGYRLRLPLSFGAYVSRSETSINDLDVRLLSFGISADVYPFAFLSVGARAGRMHASAVRQQGEVSASEYTIGPNMGFDVPVSTSVSLGLDLGFDYIAETNEGFALVSPGVRVVF